MLSPSRVLLKHVLLLCIFASSTGAADAPSVPAPNAPAKQISEIPLAEIAPRADQTIRRLDEIQQSIEGEKAVERIENDLAPLSERVKDWLNGNAKKIERVTSVIDLNDLRRNWHTFTDRLDDMQSRLERSSQRFGRYQREMEEMLAAWKAAQSAAARNRLPRPILQRAELVVRATTGLDALLKGRTAKLLSVGEQIDAQRKQMEEFGRRIERKRASIGRNLFNVDSPPLWRLFGAESVGEPLSLQVAQAWSLLKSEVENFFEDYKDLLQAHVVVFILCAVFLLWSRRSFLAEALKEDSTSAEVEILRRPLASAVLLFLIAAVWLYPRAGTDILRMIIFLTIIPSIWLGPTLVPAVWQSAVYVLIGFYCVDFFRVQIALGALSDRLLLLILDLGGAGYCAQLVWVNREKFAGLTGIGGILKKLLLGVSLLMGIAALANVAGNLSLANFLTTITIRLGYVGLVVHLYGELLSAMISFGLRSRVARVSYLVRKNGPMLVYRCRRGIRVVAFLLWSLTFFYYLGMLSGMFSTGSDFLTRKWQFGAIQISPADVLTFALVFAAAFYLSRFLRFIFREEVSPRVRLPRGVPGAIDMLSNYGILLLGFLLALSAAGVDLSKVTLVVGALGVGLGFGLQNMVSNFVSGLILAFEHPIQAGDVVETGAHFGEVKRIGFRASVVRTFDGAEVIIPNGELVWGRVINWSLSDRVRRLEIDVGTAYGTDPGRVLEILQDVALKHPDVLRSPAPLAYFEQFGDSSLNFKLRAWVVLDDFLRTKSDLAVAINGAFNQAGIQIPFPQRDLHIDWPEGIAVPRKDWPRG